MSCLLKMLLMSVSRTSSFIFSLSGLLLLRLFSSGLVGLVSLSSSNSIVKSYESSAGLMGGSIFGLLIIYDFLLSLTRSDVGIYLF